MGTYRKLLMQVMAVRGSLEVMGTSNFLVLQKNLCYD